MASSDTFASRLFLTLLIQLPSWFREFIGNPKISGLGAQRPYDQGIAEAQMAALSLIGSKTDPYVAVPALAVNRENLE